MNSSVRLSFIEYFYKNSDSLFEEQIELKHTDLITGFNIKLKELIRRQRINTAKLNIDNKKQISKVNLKMQILENKIKSLEIKITKKNDFIKDLQFANAAMLYDLRSNKYFNLSQFIQTD